MIIRVILAAVFLAGPAICQSADSTFGVEDLARLAEVGEPVFSPEWRSDCL